jgi:Ca2+-binding EF-hand superfamily protein
MSELKQVLDRIKTYIYLRDIHPIEWFQDFDRMNAGRISVAQFRRAFDTNRFPLRSGEFELISRTYRESDGSINYRRFCNAVMNIYTNLTLEKNPQGKIKDSHKIVSRTLNKATTTEDVEFGRLIAKLAHQVVTRGVHVRASYMDFDRHNSGNITQNQFMRSMPFRDLSAAEFQLLIKRYADPIVRDISYRRLHNDLIEYIRDRNLQPDQPSRWNPPSEYLPHQRNSIKLHDFNQPPDSIIENLANHVYERRIRIREFFEPHDPLRQGLITIDKFEGVLTQLGYFWTQDDLNHVTSRYRTTHQYTEYVKWWDFVADVEKLADFIHAEQSGHKVRTPTSEADRLLDRIFDSIARLRINLIPTIQDFDRFSRGYITKLQLHRALSALGIHLTNEEMDILAPLYEVENRGIDYYKFIEDVDPTHRQSRRSFKPLGTTRESIEDVWGHTPTGDRFVTGDVADQMIYESHKGLIPKVNEHTKLQELLADLQRWSFINSVHFHDFLEEHDRLNLNEITASQFRTGISRSTYKLTETEYETLIKAYHSETRPGWVKWRKFADDVIQFVAPKTLEREPQVTPLRPQEALFRHTRSIATAAPAPDVDRILDQIGRFVKTRRLSLTEQFKQKDKMNHRRVTATGFAQVLHLLGLFISKPEIDRLCQFYNDPQNNFVDYPRFMVDVDSKIGRLFGDRAKSSLVCNEIPSYGFNNSMYLVQQKTVPEEDRQWQGILRRLSAFVYRRRIRIQEFFGGFDGLRHGIIPKQKFRTVCGQAEFPITPEQIEICLAAFPVQGKDDMFNYRAFCSQVNAVFGPTELNRTPLQPGLTHAKTREDPSETLYQLDESEDKELQTILSRMRGDVITRRMNVREQFWDYDRKPRKCYISMQQFKQSIARLGLASKPREFEILCKHYCCTDLNDMNYAAFCNDVDPRD